MLSVEKVEEEVEKAFGTVGVFKMSPEQKEELCPSDKEEDENSDSI